MNPLDALVWAFAALVLACAVYVALPLLVPLLFIAVMGPAVVVIAACLLVVDAANGLWSAVRRQLRRIRP